MNEQNHKAETGVEDTYESENLIALTDEDGNEVIFEVADTVEYKGEQYLILLPVDEKDEDVVILQVMHEQNEDEETLALTDVEDETVLQKVFDIFWERSEA